MKKYTYLFIVSSLGMVAHLFSMETPTRYQIILDTDIQCGNKTQDKIKAGHASCIQQVIEQTPSLHQSVVVHAGDMIDGDEYRSLFSRLCCACIPCLKSPEQKSSEQLADFKRTFLNPLSKVPKTKVLVSPGNHEFYDATQKALNMIKDAHGGLRYTYNLGPILVIVGAVYFDKQQRDWLEKLLNGVPQEKPLIIVNHYNAIGDHDVWYPREDDAPLAKILEGRNVKRLGAHNHSDYKDKWEGHDYYCGGGKEFIALNFDELGNKISESAYLAEPQADGSYKPNPVPIPEWTQENNESDELGEKIKRTYNKLFIDQHMFD